MTPAEDAREGVAGKAGAQERNAHQARAVGILRDGAERPARPRLVEKEEESRHGDDADAEGPDLPVDTLIRPTWSERLSPPQAGRGRRWAGPC